MLKSENLMEEAKITELLKTISEAPGMEEHIADIDALSQHINESARYITEEALSTETKYNDLVTKYRERFNEGLQMTDAPEGHPSRRQEKRHYTVEDLYKTENNA